MKNQLIQIRFTHSEKQNLFSPFLGEDIERNVFNLKKKYDKLIILSSITSFFSLRFSYEISRLPLFEENLDLNPLFLPLHGAFFLFFCVISGLFVDVFGIRSTWRYFTLINALGQILLLIAQIYDTTQLKLIGQFIYFSLLPICIINFTCILYEASGELSTRLNNAIKFEVFGSMTPVVVVVLLQIILDEVSFESEHNQNQFIFIAAIILCQIFNLISLYILSKTYSVIHKLKKSSQRFILFQIKQGIFISLSKLARKFSNIDIFYLVSLSSLCGFQSIFINSFQINSSLQSNLGILVSFIFAMLVGYFSITKVNSSTDLVTTSYKASSILIYIAFAYSIVILFQSQFQIGFYFTIILSSIQGSLWIVSYVLIHQIVIFLIHQRCELRGICLSSILFVYSLFFSIASFFEINSLSFAIIQGIFSILLLIINWWYMRQRSFGHLDMIISEMYSSIY